MQNKNFKLQKFFECLLVVVGTILLSFGAIAFHAPLNINAGGLAGIGIVVKYFINDSTLKDIIYNVIVSGATVVLWVVGLIFIGKKFAERTLISSIVYIGANALFTMVPGPKDFVNYIGSLVAGDAPTAGNFLIGALFGGVFIGTGVSLTFVGGGSTGGVDVITFLLEKYLHIKESIGSFIVDGVIVITGLFVFTPANGNLFIPCLCGILSIVITAVLVDYIFIGAQISIQMDIISTEWEEISRYVQDDLLRGATIMHVNGGYNGDDKIMLRVVIDRIQYVKLKHFIAYLDPKAFITCTETHAVFGEGFKKQEKGKATKKKNNRK